MHPEGRLVAVGDTRLHVVERGDSAAPPLLVLHGGPGLDHHEFGDYLDPLTDAVRLVLVDQRVQGGSDRDAPRHTWTLAHMAADVSALGDALATDGRYAVLGHSYGSFVALQHAVDQPGAATATVAVCGIASSRWLADLDARLAAFEPVELRQQVTDSWAREPYVRSPEEVARLLHEQTPWHFADPTDPRIEEYERRSSGGRFSPAVLAHFASADYGAIDVVDRLRDVPQPLLAVAGRHDRTCPPEAAEEIAAAAPRGEVVVFENSGHMPFVEEPAEFCSTVRAFLARALVL